MAFSLVQHKKIRIEPQATSWSLAFPSPVTAGNVLVITTFEGHSGGVPTLTDTLGQTFKLVEGPDANNHTTRVWIVNNTLGGADTINISWASLQFGYLIIAEYNTGGLPLYPENDSNINGGVSSATPNFTLTAGNNMPVNYAPNELIIFTGGSANDGGSFSGLTSGYTIEESDTDVADGLCMFYADNVSPTNGSTQPQVTVAPHASGQGYDAVLVALHAPYSGPTPPAVQSYISNGTGGVRNITFPQANTVGNTIVVVLITSASIGSNQPTDTQSNTYAGIIGNFHAVADGSFLSAFFAKGIKAGANTVSITTPTGFSIVIILEYPAVSGLDVSHSGGGTGSTLNSGSITTAHATELIVSAGGSINTDMSSATPGSGFTMEKVAGPGQSQSFLAESEVVSTIGSYTGTATVVGPTTWGMMAFSFFGLASAVNVNHNVDAYVVGAVNRSHSVDAYVAAFPYIKLAMNLQFPITPPNFIRLNGTVLQQALNFVNLAGTIKAKSEAFLDLAGTIQSTTRNFVKLAGSIQNPTQRSHSVDAVVSIQNLAYVQLNGTIQGKVTPGPCGSFPDASYVNLRGWIVAPGDSIQMPNSGFTLADDFLSSQTALAAYKAMSVFILAKIALIVTAFTTGVQSWQTRTRSWLRRVDAAPSGVLINSKVNTHTLPNGAVITTTTKTIQAQDVLTTIITIQNSATPTRTSVIVTEKNKFGQTTTRETETVNINGIVHQTEKRTVFSQPPTTENIQPLKVTTLDGVQHYQFFNQVNNEWAGGDIEGVTNTTRTQQIIPSTLNGQTVDQFGNPILAKITEEKVQTPDGKTIDTTTTLTGTRDAGTTTTDETEKFNGIQTTTHTVVTYPDGSQTVTDKTTNNTTGDSTEVDVETVTDEYGQVTVTTTTIETKTFVDPTTGNVRTVETKTVVVNKGGVTTVDNQVDTTTDFEDDIYATKVQLFYIQEFTLNVVIDEMSMFALWEINETHQKNFALLELFSQQLSNLNLSYKLRQNLITQYNTANSCIAPVTLQANGRTYQVVFAPSASAFRAKYIPGTEPHVYELQMILQERSNLITGTKGFF